MQDMEMKLIEKDGIIYADSREVAKMTGKSHAHLCRDIAGYVKTLSKNPNLDSSIFFAKSTYKQTGNGKEVRCYLLTKKGCDMVANKMTGEKGVLFTATYINKFYEMEKKLASKNTLALPNFNNPAEAARAWADQYEKAQNLLSENEAMKPKAEFYDVVANVDKLLSMDETAKVLDMGIGRNNLFKILRDKKILMDNNIPYQRYINSGYFKSVERTTRVNNVDKIYIVTFVKQKGLDYIRKLLVKDGYRCKNTTLIGA